MFRVMKGVLLAIVITLCAMGVAASDAGNGWLVGKWEMTFDPDGSEKDWMEFSADGSAYSIAADGRRVPGKYSLSGQSVNIVYTFNGKDIPITLTYNADKTKLLAHSQRTGNTSEYQKVQQ